MATAGSNKNIFELLSDNESDGEMQQVKVKGEKRVRTRGKKTEQSASGALNNANVNEDVNSLPKDSQRGNKNPKDAKKSKGVSSEPHPLDRKSGTGRGKEMSKGGAGKGNWGTYKDEDKDVLEKDEEVKSEEEEEVVQTLEEYMLARQKAQASTNQFKRALDQKALDQMIQKDNCQLVQKKANIDDHFFNKGKNAKGKDKAPRMTTEDAELLGVRSGLQTYTEKPRENREERQERPKKEFKAQEETKEENTEEKQENTEEQTQKTDNRGKGKGESRGKGEGRGQGGRGRGGRGRGDGKTRGDGKGRGGKFEGNRGPRNNNSNKVANIEDDNSFPTLG